LLFVLHLSFFLKKNHVQDVGADFMNSAVDRFYKAAGGAPPSASGGAAGRRAVPVAQKKKD
jgi:hypothetical protein